MPPYRRAPRSPRAAAPSAECVPARGRGKARRRPPAPSAARPCSDGRCSAFKPPPPYRSAFCLESTCLEVVDRRLPLACTEKGWHGRRPPTMVAGRAHSSVGELHHHLLGTVTRRGTHCRF